MSCFNPISFEPSLGCISDRDQPYQNRGTSCRIESKHLFACNQGACSNDMVALDHMETDLSYDEQLVDMNISNDEILMLHGDAPNEQRIRAEEFSSKIDAAAQEDEINIQCYIHPCGKHVACQGKLGKDQISLQEKLAASWYQHYYRSRGTSPCNAGRRLFACNEGDMASFSADLIALDQIREELNKSDDEASVLNEAIEYFQEDHLRSYMASQGLVLHDEDAICQEDLGNDSWKERYQHRDTPPCNDGKRLSPRNEGGKESNSADIMDLDQIYDDLNKVDNRESIMDENVPNDQCIQDVHFNAERSLDHAVHPQRFLTQHDKNAAGHWNLKKDSFIVNGNEQRLDEVQEDETSLNGFQHGLVYDEIQHACSSLTSQYDGKDSRNDKCFREDRCDASDNDNDIREKEEPCPVPPPGDRIQQILIHKDIARLTLVGQIKREFPEPSNNYSSTCALDKLHQQRELIARADTLLTAIREKSKSREFRKLEKSRASQEKQTSIEIPSEINITPKKKEFPQKIDINIEHQKLLDNIRSLPGVEIRAKLQKMLPNVRQKICAEHRNAAKKRIKEYKAKARQNDTVRHAAFVTKTQKLHMPRPTSTIEKGVEKKPLGAKVPITRAKSKKRTKSKNVPSVGTRLYESTSKRTEEGKRRREALERVQKERALRRSGHLVKETGKISMANASSLYDRCTQYRSKVQARIEKERKRKCDSDPAFQDYSYH